VPRKKTVAALGATEQQRGCSADEIDEHGNDWVALPAWRPARETEWVRRPATGASTVTHGGEATAGFRQALPERRRF
jgi:hypothetical protein